jgi:hypothetical protein
MALTYKPDSTSMEMDPRLSQLVFDPASHRAAFESETGQEIYRILTSRFGVALLIGAITAAPSRPPVVASEPWILKAVGEQGFTDEMKKYTGRAVRMIVEELGGRWVRKGVKTTVESKYTKASIYNFC